MKRRFGTHILLASMCGFLFSAPMALALDNVTIQLSGGDEALQTKLDNNSGLKRAQNEELTVTSDLLALARTEYSTLIGVLYSEGYYGGAISVKIDGKEAADLSPLQPPPQIRQIVVRVDPGKQFKFSRAEVGPLAPETELPREFARGEIARSGLIKDASTAATTGWRKAGHAKAKLADDEVRANHAEADLSVKLTMAPGPKLRFGPLTIVGNEKVRTERIAEIAGLPEGEVYSPETLEKVAARLRKTETFRGVKVSEADQPGPGDLLPITLEVQELPPRRFGFGAEISTSEGVSVNTFWLHRNIFGGAERLRFDFDVENIGAKDEDIGENYRIGAYLTRPATLGPDSSATSLIQLERLDERGYIADNFDIAFGFERVLSEHLTGSIALGYRWARVEDAFGEREYSLISMPTRLIWDNRDNELDATRGFYVNGAIRPFVGIDEMENGAQATLDARSYIGFGEDARFVLAGRAQIGSLFGPELNQAPPDYLFFAGGGGSVRGHPVDNLGAGEVNGTIVGGRSFVGLSGEVRTKITDAIGVVGFIDSGYIGAEEYYDGTGEWITGAGIGLRYDTGLGPIRVDLATPTKGQRDGDPDYQLYIGIGQAF